MANIFGDFPLRGEGGTPQFRYAFLAKRFLSPPPHTSLTEKTRLVVLDGFPNVF